MKKKLTEKKKQKYTELKLEQCKFSEIQRQREKIIMKKKE